MKKEEEKNKEKKTSYVLFFYFIFTSFAVFPNSDEWIEDAKK
jgi:hypothetical protein